MKAPWTTTKQADSLYFAAKAIQAELSELDGVDLLPKHKPLSVAIEKLDAILNEIDRTP